MTVEPMDLVRALRAKASWFTVLAEVVDENTAAVALEEAVQLRCHAAAVEQLSELYDELGRQAKQWDELRKLIRPAAEDVLDRRPGVQLGTTADQTS